MPGLFLISVIITQEVQETVDQEAGKMFFEVESRTSRFMPDHRQGEDDIAKRFRGRALTRPQLLEWEGEHIGRVID